MEDARGSLLRVCFKAGMPTESAYGVALALTGTWKAFQATTPNHVEPFQTVDKIFDCTGQYQIGERVLKRGARLRIEADMDAGTFAAVLAWTFGVAAAPASAISAITMLGAKSFQPASTTLVITYDDGEDAGVVLRGACVNRLEVNGVNGDAVKVTLDIVGMGDLQPATSFTPPDCVDIGKVYFEDGALTVNSADRFSCTDANHSTYGFSFEYSNNLAIEDAAPLAKKDFIRLERGERRDYMARWKVGGRPLDTIDTEAFNRTTTNSFSFRVGSATEGVTITCTKALMYQNSPLVTHEGEVRRAVLNEILQPLRISGNAATPLSASAHFTGNTVQFLVAES